MNDNLGQIINANIMLALNNPPIERGLIKSILIKETMRLQRLPIMIWPLSWPPPPSCRE